MPDPGYFTKLRRFLTGTHRRTRNTSRRAGRRRFSARSEPAFTLESLEPRVLLAADLAAAVQAVQMVPEQAATVLVTNNGPDRVSNAPVAVHASQDTALDATDVSLGSRRVEGNLRAGQSDDVSVGLNFSSLAPGAYHILGSVTDVNGGNPANNVGVGPRVLKDADGTVALFSLRGPGQIDLLQDGSQWDVRVTGTTDQSVLILQSSGDDRRVTIDVLHVQGPLGALVAPTMDLVGTLAVNGPVTAGLAIRSATGAVIAAPEIKGIEIQGETVRGLAIGTSTDSTILIGTNLGADGQFGGTGANADTFGVSPIGRLFINGRFINDVQSPTLTAAPATDSGRPGDGLTNSATITGTASDQSGVTTLRAGFNGVPSVDMSSTLQGGAFALAPSDLAAINGGTLPDGSYTLTLLARDANGIGRVTQVAFTLDTTPPATLMFDLAPASDTDPDGDQQTMEPIAALVGQTEANAAVDLVGLNKQTTADANGDFSFTDVSLTLGANTFTAQAMDAAGNQRTESRTITRVTANQPPVANPDTKTTPQNTPLSFSATDLTVNDTDPDGNTLIVTAVAATANSNGTVSLNNGTVTYTPASNFTGPTSFEYTVSDGAGETATGVVNVTVTPVNQPPLARPIARPNPAEATSPDGAVITFDGSASAIRMVIPCPIDGPGPLGRSMARLYKPQCLWVLIL